MKCPTCKTELIERNGKYGPFVCCPRGNHGTFSIQNGTMYFTGEVGNMLRKTRVDEVYSAMQLEGIDKSPAYQPSLTHLINTTVAQFGWDSSKPLNQLAEFLVGGPNDNWDEEERNNPNAWWNDRPY